MPLWSATLPRSCSPYHWQVLGCAPPRPPRPRRSTALCVAPAADTRPPPPHNKGPLIYHKTWTPPPFPNVCAMTAYGDSSCSRSLVVPDGDIPCLPGLVVQRASTRSYIGDSPLASMLLCSRCGFVVPPAAKLQTMRPCPTNKVGIHKSAQFWRSVHGVRVITRPSAIVAGRADPRRRSSPPVLRSPLSVARPPCPARVTTPTRGGQRGVTPGGGAGGARRGPVEPRRCCCGGGAVHRCLLVLRARPANRQGGGGAGVRSAAPPRVPRPTKCRSGWKPAAPPPPQRCGRSDGCQTTPRRAQPPST